MPKIAYNSFIKSTANRTAYQLIQGQPVLAETIRALTPMHPHKRSPAFTLLWEGKHVVGFHRHAGGGYTGNFKGNALLVFLKESGFDLFVTNITPAELVANLQTETMVATLYKARKAANSFLVNNYKEN